MTTVIFGILLPLLGTALGAACVFFMWGEMDRRVRSALSGFAAGIMVAASVWSLLIPAVELSVKRGRNPLALTSVGFVLGVLTFIACEKLLELMKKQKSSHIRYGKSFLPSLDGRRLKIPLPLCEAQKSSGIPRGSCSIFPVSGVKRRKFP